MKNKTIYFVRGVEITLLILSFIVIFDSFNTGIIIENIFLNKNISLVLNQVRTINLVLFSGLTAVSYYNLVRYDILNLYILPSLLTISLVLEINRFMIGTFNQTLSVLIILLISTGIFLDNIFYYDFTNKDKKKALLFSLICLVAIITHKFLLGNKIDFNFIISFICIFIIVLILYLMIKNQKFNYSLLFGVIIMANIVLFISHNSYVDVRFFYLIYNILKSFYLICLFLGIFYYNFKKSHMNLAKRESQIQLYANKINKVVKKRTKEIERMNKRLNEDLEYARKIQQSLLPVKHLKFNNVYFVSNYYPCEKLSGDFYDIFRIDNKHIGMYLLDVSGHGVSAAMLTMFGKNSIISGERLIRRYRGLKPHRNLEHFYEVFNRADFPSETHMVMLFASYNTDTGVLKYSSGGMNCYPIVIPKDGNIYELSDNTGFPISKLGEFFTPDYTSSSTVLNKGDIVLFYTDGLTDYKKNNVIKYNELINLLNNEKDIETIDELISNRIENLETNLEDDITYFIMKVD